MTLDYAGPIDDIEGQTLPRHVTQSQRVPSRTQNSVEAGFIEKKINIYREKTEPGEQGDFGPPAEVADMRVAMEGLVGKMTGPVVPPLGRQNRHGAVKCV